MKAELDRIRTDFQHGGKLGPKSTERLLALLEQIIKRVEKLERKVGIE